MLHYARSDTHFLLFVYDQLREALIERSKTPDPSKSVLVDGPQGIPPSIHNVLKHSADTSLQEFVREQYDAEKGEGSRGWGALARKWNKRSLLVDGPSRRVFLAVHKWRDEVSVPSPPLISAHLSQVAREEDESAVYVAFLRFLLMCSSTAQLRDLQSGSARFNRKAGSNQPHCTIHIVPRSCSAPDTKARDRATSNNARCRLPSPNHRNSHRFPTSRRPADVCCT